MNDMRAVIVPKSDQINADDLIGGPLTITITAVSIRPGTEQPVTINFDGDGGKPYKPCKTMSRVLVNFWGPDANKYVGKSLTLYRDPKVLWGGMEVGGIRISHMSDIDGAHTMALTVKKGSKKLHVVKPLAPPPTTAGPQDTQKPVRTARQFLDELESSLQEAEDDAAVAAILAQPDVIKAKATLRNGYRDRLMQIIAAATEAPTLDDATDLIAAYAACNSAMDIQATDANPAVVTQKKKLSAPDRERVEAARREKLKALADDDFPGDRA
jgi:hypothetical protein